MLEIYHVNNLTVLPKILIDITLKIKVIFKI